MTPSTDDQLRARFHALRASDEVGAPEFRSLVDRAQFLSARHQPVKRRPVAWIALVLGAAAAIVLAVLSRTGGDPSPTPALPDWSSPTGAFLTTPGDELLQAPDLFSSVLDRMTSTTAQPKGD